MSYEFFHRPLAEVLRRALSEDAFYVEMEKSADGAAAERREAMVRYMDFSMKEARETGVLRLWESLGASLWTKPVNEAVAEKTASAKKEFLAKHMGGGSLSTYRRIVEAMVAESREVIPPECWYLSILGVAPEAQGRGIGVKLVEPVLAEADAAGVATYLETFTPRNKSFYKRLGYRDAKTIHEPLTGAEYSIMVREPGGQRPGDITSG